MEPEGKASKSCELDYISPLPISIIHHIYSLLPPRDIASTSALSKIWNSYWCMYPYVTFNFVYPSYNRRKLHEVPLALRNQSFVDMMEKAVKRRLGREFYIQRFQMYIEFSDLLLFAPYLNRWISSAMGKGVPELARRVDIMSDSGLWCHYSVPQVVLRAESLKVLSLSGCNFNKGLEVKLPQLKRFSLNRCNFEDVVLFHMIMTGCPVIEFVKTSYCTWMGTVLSVSSIHSLKHFEFLRDQGIKNVEIHAPNLQKFSFASTPGRWPPSLDLKSCSALKELKLVGQFRVGLVSNILPQHVISQLPVLEVLEFQYCTGFQDLRISSQMLKRLAVRNCYDLKLVEVDTANLQSFECCFFDEPFISINAPTDLRVHLIFELRCYIDWFTRLESFLSTWSAKADLKLVVYHLSKDMIIHERLRDIPLSALCNFMFPPKSLCISSKSFTNLMDELIPAVYPKNVHVIYSHDKTFEVLSQKIEDVTSNPNLKFKLGGFKVKTCADVQDRMDPVIAVFVEKHSIPPYRDSVITLYWKPNVSGRRVMLEDVHC